MISGQQRPKVTPPYFRKMSHYKGKSRENETRFLEKKRKCFSYCIYISHIPNFIELHKMWH